MSSDENGGGEFFEALLVCFLCSLLFFGTELQCLDCFFNLALGAFSLFISFPGLGETLIDKIIVELLSFESHMKREISRYVCQVCKRSLAPAM